MSTLQIVIVFTALAIGSVIFILLYFQIIFWIGDTRSKNDVKKDRNKIGKCYLCDYDLTGLPHSLRLREAKDKYQDRQVNEFGTCWEYYRTCPECGHEESIEDYKYLNTCLAYKRREINLDDRR